ncbi:MAG: CPBP family intramembrane metalloprotease [Acidobacteria bacterium]|nr:CPBP family intramembrane metalloprotease [Acidobacteriota bacterium]
MLTPLPTTAVVAFTALAAAMMTVWAPRVWASPHARSLWVAPFGIALLAAQSSGLIGTPGLIALFVLITATRAGYHAPEGALRGFALAVMLALSAGLLLHAVPGFENPRLLDNVRLSPDSAPYTKYLNFDKGVLGLFLLGLYAPARTLRRSPAGSWLAAFWRFAVVAAMVMVLTVAVGYARWDPKLPSWWTAWLASMVFFTALPEEAVFRHVIQGGLQAWLGPAPQSRWTALAAGGVLFGLAHVGGGWIYVMLATAAGLGYGLVYAITGSIVAAALAHIGLNLLHLLFFSYPALHNVG